VENQRQAKKAATRASILTAAAGQFALHGYDGTTFSSVAEAMGRPKSAVGYHQFAAKQDLAAAVMHHQWDRWAALLVTAESIPAGLPRLLTVLLSAVLDAETNTFAAATVRLVADPATSGIAVPGSAFSWRAYGADQIRISIQAEALPDTVDPAALMEALLIATFGVHATKEHGLLEINTEPRLRRVWYDILTGHHTPYADKTLSLIPAAGVPLEPH
jgi:AcrR family transcriptional regulator